MAATAAAQLRIEAKCTVWAIEMQCRCRADSCGRIGRPRFVSRMHFQDEKWLESRHIVAAAFKVDGG